MVVAAGGSVYESSGYPLVGTSVGWVIAPSDQVSDESPLCTATQSADDFTMSVNIYIYICIYSCNPLSVAEEHEEGDDLRYVTTLFSPLVFDDVEYLLCI